MNRRAFLGHSGSVVGLTVLASPLSAFGASPQPPPPPGSKNVQPEKLPPLSAPTERTGGDGPAFMPPDDRVGFAIVGLGHLALEEILPAFAQSKACRPTALVSGDKAKARRVARQYGIPETHLYTYEEFDRIKENKDVQAVYIVLPNSMHREYTLRAAKAGKHVLCEKPMSVNAADAQAMVDACRAAKVKLMIAYRQQYEPNNRFIQQLVRQKTYGRVKLFEAHNGQNESGAKGGHQQWRHVKALAGGGALPDIGLYCLNAARFLSGEEPEEVCAWTYSTPNDPRFTQIEESIAFQLKFPSGLIASCTSSYGVHNNKRYRFMAENAWFGMDPSFSYRGLKTEVSRSEGQLELKEQVGIDEKNQFALEMDHMADCVLHDRPPQSPGEEGVQDHKIMDALYESARTGQPVRLARIEGLDHFRNPASLK